MTTSETESTGLVFEGRWDIPYRYSAGLQTQRFFERLRDARTVSGSPCPQCAAVYVPPRSFCERCFVDIETLVDIAPAGTIQAFTVVHAQFAGLPEPPYVVAYALLDGASTSVVNYIEGLEYDEENNPVQELRIGSRVALVFTDAPEGKMTDFHFVLQPPAGAV